MNKKDVCLEPPVAERARQAHNPISLPETGTCTSGRALNRGTPLSEFQRSYQNIFWGKFFHFFTDFNFHF